MNEHQAYDRIMRENLRQVFMPLIAEKLQLTITTTSPLPDKQVSTILRETDSFILVETDSETRPKIILHLEFESGHDPNIIYRISEYHGVGLRKYMLPIEHFVIYLGEQQPTMQTELKKEEVFSKFTLIDANKFSAQQLLESDVPEVIILAILAGYKKENASIIIRAILRRLVEVCKTESDMKKFYHQLTLLSNLRKLQPLTKKIIENMPMTFDIKEDYIYQLGREDAEKDLLAILETEREQAKQEREKAKQEREKAKQEREQAKQEREKAKQERKQTIRKMLKANLDIETIADFSCLSIEDVIIILEEIKVEEENNRKYADDI
jgi:predicted transposase YdaD